MKIILLLLMIVQIAVVKGQEFGLGLNLDDPLLETSPTAAPLMRGDYSNLPKAASLKEYAPVPKHQGQYGTCTGWASAYAARTILEAYRNRWSQEEIKNNSFSPSFVYNQIRSQNDCMGGASIIEALNLLRDYGDLKFSDFGYECSRKITDQDRLRASPYKILEYREIVNRKTVNKHNYVKKSIAEGKPVVLAFDCPYSFLNARESWTPDSIDYKEWRRGHAIAAVSYDDDKFGGAIEIINSWGTAWGNQGFTWIKYRDFDYFCKLAFEMIAKTKDDSSRPDLSGRLFFKESTGREMKARFNGSYFIMEKPYPANTLFELRISNNEPAYVYAFSSDLTYKTYKIFPFTDRMLAYLPYKQNNIAIPDEESYNMLDTSSGTSYFCFVYSKKSLNIDSIMTRIEKGKGPFWDRITAVFGSSMVNKKDIDFSYKDGIIFSARSRGKTLVPVLVEFKHL
ncbi:MAG: C1 family peptidase [Ignavibacteriales bacterium]